METGQWFTPRQGHRWWFDSGATVLDFAYTGSMGHLDPAGRAGAGERLTTPEGLAEWLTARFPSVDGRLGERDLIDAKAFRDAVARSATATAHRAEIAATDVDVINLFAATPDIAPSLGGGGRQAGSSRARPAQALSTMAREAVTLFGSERDRLRECDADDCQLVFYDGSRANNRRWCSMQRCGNRAKVRAHRARTTR
ncbi:CGNR zinc finger domain-containing protein [soil metagenome]